MLTTAYAAASPTPDPHSYTLRPLCRCDLTRTANLHRQQLPHGLFPSLGESFLRIWHSTFIDSPSGHAVVVFDSTTGDLAGYLLLATEPSAHVRDAINNHRAAMALRAIAALASRPGLALWFVRTRSRRYLSRINRLRHRGGGPTSGEAEPAVIHAVVTHPDHRGRGVARRLLDWAEIRTASRDVNELALVTADEVADTGRPAGAAAMYEHLGWRRVATRSRDGQPVAEYRRTLASTKGGTTG